MATIKIDNIDYDIDALSVDAKAHLTSLRFVDSEIQRLQGNIAVFQAARGVYLNALKRNLPTLPAGDTIKLN